MATDALLYILGLGLTLGVAWCLWALGGARRAGVERAPADPVPLAVRLAADRRQSVSRAHVSAVRPRDPRVGAVTPSPRQRAAIRHTHARVQEGRLNAHHREGTGE